MLEPWIRNTILYEYQLLDFKVLYIYNNTVTFAKS